MNSKLDSSGIEGNSTYDQYSDRLQAVVDLYLRDHSDGASTHFLKRVFKSLLLLVREKEAQSDVTSIGSLVDEADILRLAGRHLYYDAIQPIGKEIKSLNKAISYLREAGLGAIPLVDVSKIAAKYSRPQAIAIDHVLWSTYVKVEKLYEFFLNHFEVQNRKEDLAFAVVFSMIVNGCHFERSYLSIIDTIVSDFSPDHSWILLQKKYKKKGSPREVKMRCFLSSISIIYLMRLLRYSSSIESLDDRLFPTLLRGRHRDGYEFSKRFKKWLDALVAAFNGFQGVAGDYCLGDAGVIRSVTIRELYKGARIWTALRYPFFETSCLSHKLVPGQLTPQNYKALFSSDHIIYPSRLQGGSAMRSWLRGQSLELSDRDSDLSDDAFLKLMSIHGSTCKLLQTGQTKIGKQERGNIASEIRGFADSLPHPAVSLFGVENGYQSNYRLLLKWLAALVQRKIALSTALGYFSNLANAFYFALADSSIISMDQFALTDLMAEIIHSYPSPRSQRTIKNKLKQFLMFLGSLYPLPKLDWSHPELWIVDEPIEREIMGFSEFDAVYNEIGDTSETEIGDTLKAAMILLFYAGLRIHEAALLSHDAVFIDSELNIYIRKSKTRAGRRSIPLHLIVPEKERRFLMEYILKQRPKGSRKDVPVLTLDKVSFLDPNVLADMITSVIYKCLGRRITCHQLRHSFASWFLVRWYSLVYGLKTIELFSNESTHPIFAPAELNKLRTLCIGKGPERVGDKYFMHAISVLGKLLGHAGPVTTVTVYTHTIDVLYRLILAERDGNHLVSITKASRILGVSYPTASRLVGDGKMVPMTALMKYTLSAWNFPGGKV